MMNDKLEQLQKYLEKMEQFNHVNTLLYWDMRTNTPKEGFAGHSDALTYFSTEQFSMSTSDELKTLLDTLAEPEEFEKLQHALDETVTVLMDNIHQAVEAVLKSSGYVAQRAISFEDIYRYILRYYL